MWALECQYTWKRKEKGDGASLGRYMMRYCSRVTNRSTPKARFPLWIEAPNSEMSITSCGLQVTPENPWPQGHTDTPFCSLWSGFTVNPMNARRKLTACASSSSNLRSSRVQSVSSGRSRSQTTLFTLATTVLSARPWLQTENNPGGYLARLAIKNYCFFRENETMMQKQRRPH